MQEVIHPVTKDEASCTFCGNLLLEGELRRQEKIATETDGVTQRIGHIDVDPQIQQQIDAIMNRRGNHTHDAKTYEFLKTGALYELFDLIQS